MPTTNSPAKPTPYAASDSPLTGSVTTLASVALSTVDRAVRPERVPRDTGEPHHGRRGAVEIRAAVTAGLDRGG
jgi:hypothetical protein